MAHFYNTIDRQMIPSQQAMMLDAAMAFEHIIKNPKAGAKSNSEVGKYMYNILGLTFKVISFVVYMYMYVGSCDYHMGQS